jgi:hypothetical protein
MFGIITQRCSAARTAASGPRGLFLLLALVLFGACDSSTTGPVEPENQAPSVASVTMAPDGYRKARLTGSVSDPEGAIDSVVIDWGDGTTTDVTGDPASISIEHTYDRAQDYSVTLTVTDAEGLSAQRASSIRIEVPDPFCLDFFKIAGICIGGSSNLKNFDVEVRVLNKVVYEQQVREGDGRLDIPLGAGIGTITIDFDMDQGRFTVTGEVCPVPFLVCQEILSQTIYFEA